MTIYTYKFTKSLSSFLGIDPILIPELSDQELKKIPNHGHCENIRPAHIEYLKSDEFRKFMSGVHKGKIGHWNGKKFSKKHKENLSLNHSDVNGKNNPMFGKSHPNKGKKFYNNGLSQKVFFEGHQPEGWVKGRILAKLS